MRAFIIGAYGCGNCGDDAILQAICENLKGYDITATTGNVKDVAKELPVKSVPCRLNEGFSIKILLQMIKDSFQILHGIAKSDALIFGGGSLIHDLTSYNLPFMFLWQRVAELFGKPSYYACIGIGPINTEKGRKSCIKWLSRAKGVYPRDQRGVDFCERNRISNYVPSSDVAFSYRKPCSNSQSALEKFGLKKGDYICITASRWLKNENYWRKSINEEADETFREFFNCVVQIQKRLNRKIVFVPSEQRDFVMGQTMSTWSKGEFINLPAALSCTELEGIVENSYMVFGMRMHPLIFALRQGVPVISIIYDEKVRELMKKMDLLYFAIDLCELNVQDVLERLDFLENGRNEIIEKINQNANKCACEARACCESIRYSIENG